MDAQSFISTYQPLFFPESSEETPWSKNELVKRYYLQFPMFPFRTLNPRSVNLISSKLNEFDATSPLFPANTQMNILFKKRKKNNFINFMLPFQLDPNLGSLANIMTAQKKQDACSINLKTIVEGAEVVQKWVIGRVDINVKDMYLQVMAGSLKIWNRFFYNFYFDAGGSFEIQGPIT